MAETENPKVEFKTIGSKSAPCRQFAKTYCSPRRANRSGLTLVELFVVLVIIGILIGMMLPAVRQVREPARRATRMNQIRQIALSSHLYESAHGCFPPAMGSLEEADHDGFDNQSGLVFLLPFLEQASLYNQIGEPLENEGIVYPAFPAPWQKEYPPWQEKIYGFYCPSSGLVESEFGTTSYAFCVGDTARNIHNPEVARGGFACKLKTDIASITDGCSNTIGIVEIGNSTSRSINANFAIELDPSLFENPRSCLKFDNQKQDAQFSRDVQIGVPGRGECWADGRAGCGIANTILPPNSPSCAVSGAHGSNGFFSASSFHPGEIVIVAMMDGSAHTTTADVDCGELAHPVLIERQFAEFEPSPFGVWGALGASNDGSEVSTIDL